VGDPRQDSGEKVVAYAALLMDGLATPAMRSGHANVLSHLQTYLCERLEDALAIFCAHREELRLDPLTVSATMEPEVRVSPVPPFNEEMAREFINDIFGDFQLDIKKQVEEATRSFYGRK